MDRRAPIRLRAARGVGVHEGWFHEARGRPSPAAPAISPSIGPTEVPDLANLVLLCRGCHTGVHDHGWQVTRRDDGTWHVLRPTRDTTGCATDSPTHPRPTRPNSDEPIHEAHTPSDNPGTNRSARPPSTDGADGAVRQRCAVPRGGPHRRRHDRQRQDRSSHDSNAANRPAASTGATTRATGTPTATRRMLGCSTRRDGRTDASEEKRRDPSPALTTCAAADGS